MKKLICHTSIYNGDQSVLTKGRAYPVIEENEVDFMISNDEGDNHHFTKKPFDGESYKTWFRLEGTK